MAAADDMEYEKMEMMFPLIAADKLAMAIDTMVERGLMPIDDPIVQARIGYGKLGEYTWTFKRGGVIRFSEPLETADVAKMRLSLTQADQIARVCDELVSAGKMNARSAIADARLNYGTPYEYLYTKAPEATVDVSDSLPLA
jgi:hypothetical protein